VENNICIEVAARQDAEMLSRIGSAAFRAAYAPYNSPEDVESHLAKNYTVSAIQEEIREGKSYRLATIDDRAVGLCKFIIARSPAVLGDERSLEIQQLYVSPEIQRSGIGIRFVDYVRGIARKEELDGVWLGVWESADWAIRFYKACGFEKFGSHEFYLGESCQRDLLMALPCHGRISP
jgi:ribosomal protein S18 acetylase RimI-like enzyme